MRVVRDVGDRRGALENVTTTSIASWFEWLGGREVCDEGPSSFAQDLIADADRSAFLKAISQGYNAVTFRMHHRKKILEICIAKNITNLSGWKA